MLGMRLKEESVNKQTMLHDDIGDLVKFKKNLRWRKWPEEKPRENEGRCLVSHYNEIMLYVTEGLDTDGSIDASVVPHWQGLASDCLSLCDKNDLWIPLSALLKPEDRK